MTFEEYINSHLEKEPEYLSLIARKANVQLLNPRMQSGYYQGRLLKILTRIINPKNVLEIGTFSGYSTLCIAEGVSENTHIHTIEIDDELEDFINENFALSPFKHKITLHIGDALKIIPDFSQTFDLVFIDGDKREYQKYFDMVLPKLSNNGVILVDNTLWNGKILETPKNNDYQTKNIIDFNAYIANYQEIEQIILPVRDGLTIIIKKF